MTRGERTADTARTTGAACSIVHVRAGGRSGPPAPDPVLVPAPVPDPALVPDTVPGADPDPEPGHRSAPGRRPRTAVPPGSGERGAGAVLVVGLCGAIAVLTLVLVPLLGGFAAHARARSAADAGALAAADALSGRIGGDPCERAAETVGSVDATMRSCTLDGATATVETAVDLGWVVVTAGARAGPAPSTGPGRRVARTSPDHHPRTRRRRRVIGTLHEGGASL